MRKRKVILLIVCIILLISTNGFAIDDKSIDVRVTVTSKEIKEDLTYIHQDVTYPVVNINKYKEAQEKINKKIGGDIESWRVDLNKSAKQYENDYKDIQGELIPFEIVSKYKVALNKDNILSIPVDYYQYTGGAHGLTIRNGYNFAVNTGTLLSLGDLFKDNYNYIKIINNNIKNQIAKNPEEYFDNGAVFKTIKVNQDFYLTEDALIIYFQLYEIAPYVGGIREFKIPYSEIKEGLKYPIT
ncbi:protein of unknown function [Clostridium cavendishii DSM 21758]|uniref:Deacetylase PdaC domain-containing protein n=1 Tax=Clostridium cavendishii DSM 21758 TaxID=1121302 RepID=A0A1M6LS61_9CLOT|nr:DUF3298 and DUF4163 domain-containing protein [Clostridium cavendishii]SHJ74040.1 protein of unknown function [Clostridium cavendishii DSM 21758]